MIAMNSTGKEFFSKKQTAYKQGGAQAQQTTGDSQQTAVQIQKTSIEILKQLQKRKQGMAAGSVTRKPSGHPKVVINPNNPFFAKQNNK